MLKYVVALQKMFAGLRLCKRHKMWTAALDEQKRPYCVQCSRERPYWRD